MSDTFAKVCKLVAEDHWLPTTHALQRLAERQILIGDVLGGLSFATVVEDYPGDPRGESVLVLSFDGADLPIHALWGIPSSDHNLVKLVTVYRPDPLEWHPDWKTRKQA